MIEAILSPRLQLSCWRSFKTNRFRSFGAELPFFLLAWFFYQLAAKWLTSSLATPSFYELYNRDWKPDPHPIAQSVVFRQTLVRWCILRGIHGDEEFMNSFPSHSFSFDQHWISMWCSAHSFASINVHICLHPASTWISGKWIIIIFI